MPRYLILPVEVKARELHAKTYLAHMATKAGFTVLLGHSSVLQQVAPSLPPAIYLEKNIFPAREKLFRQLRSAGHRVVAWDEEAIAVFNYDWYVAKNVQAHMLDLVDAFFTWGTRDRDEIAHRHPGHLDRLLPTGNPRADLLRPEHRSLLADESDQYRQRFGDYLLILSNFSRVNTYGEGIEDYVANVARVSRLDAATRSYFLGALLHMQDLFSEFRAVLPRLSQAFPDRQIVIRPHPAEILETWQEAARGLANVHVVREGTAVGWIDGAAAIMHNGCTTGIEAFLMGRLPIAYRPILSDEFEIKLPNALSLDARSADDLVGCLASEASRAPRVDVERAEYAERMPIASAIVCSSEGALAAERLLPVLEELSPETRSDAVDFTPIQRRLRLSAARERAETMLREPLRFAKSKMTGRSYTPSAVYKKQKYEGTTLRELEQFGTALLRVRPALANVRLHQILPDCFLFEPAT